LSERCLGAGGGTGGGDGFEEDPGGFLEITGLGFQDFLLLPELISAILLVALAVLEAAPAFAQQREVGSWSPYFRMALLAENYEKSCATPPRAFCLGS
jgi:hypothetical protein